MSRSPAASGAEDLGDRLSSETGFSIARAAVRAAAAVDRVERVTVERREGVVALAPADDVGDAGHVDGDAVVIRRSADVLDQREGGAGRAARAADAVEDERRDSAAASESAEGDGVGARIPVHEVVVAEAREELVVAVTTGEEVARARGRALGLSAQQVRAAAAVEGVVGEAADQLVRPRVTGQGVLSDSSPPRPARRRRRLSALPRPSFATTPVARLTSTPWIAPGA